MKDIINVADVEFLVNSFYEVVKKDALIGYVFNDIAKVDWEEHLPIMYNFWSSVLLRKSSYRGNPLQKHLALNQKVRLKEEHFDRWLTIWKETIDKNFSGELADRAKKQAQTIKLIMMHKIRESESF